VLTGLVAAFVGLPLIAAAFWRLCRSARAHQPHHATGPLADRPYPLA
jgi:hypothetical protein